MFDAFTADSAISGGDNGFFGELSSVADNYLNALGSDILPNWTAKQLGMQSVDQLRQPTYNPQTSFNSQEPTIQNADSALIQNRFNIGAGGLMIIGGIFIVTVLVLKKF